MLRLNPAVVLLRWLKDLEERGWNSWFPVDEECPHCTFPHLMLRRNEDGREGRLCPNCEAEWTTPDKTPLESFRVLLLPAMAIVELVLIAISWVLAFVRPELSKGLVTWAFAHLPDRDWYLGGSSKRVR